MKFPAKQLALASTLLGAYALFRQPMLRWGTTAEERRAAFPRPDLIPPQARRFSIMAATLDAPPSDVYPWLVQMGYERGGYYSWDILHNLAKPSANRVHPEWQNRAVGDRVSGGGVACFEVAGFEPNRFFALRSLPIRGPLGDVNKDPALWAFELVPLGPDRTRVIVSVYGTRRFPAAAIDLAFWEWAHWIMQIRQFQNLERRVVGNAAPAEQAAGPPEPSTTVV